MDAEISPEPTPSEREAIGAALDELLEPETGDPSGLYRSAWRLAGLRENADATPEPWRLRPLPASGGSGVSLRGR